LENINTNRADSEKIWKIQKKCKLNSEKIWKIQKKSKLNIEKRKKKKNEKNGKKKPKQNEKKMGEKKMKYHTVRTREYYPTYPKTPEKSTGPPPQLPVAHALTRGNSLRGHDFFFHIFF
jgi:hypothetical protein